MPCYILKNCYSSETIETNTDLEDYLNSVVTIEGEEGCWKVLNCTYKEGVQVVDEFFDCRTCQPKCKQKDC